MSNLRDVLLHWRKKLERTTDDDVVSAVIRKLDRVPMTIELLQETGIGKIIRTLRKREGEVGEKATALLTTWREIVSTSQKPKEKSKRDTFLSETVSNNKNKNSDKVKDPSSTTFTDKYIHHKLNKSDTSKLLKRTTDKETSTRYNECEPSEMYQTQTNKDKSAKYVLDECSDIYKNGNEIASVQKLSSPYSYNKTKSTSSHIDYDLNSDINEGYSPDHPELFPMNGSPYGIDSDNVSGKRKSTVDFVDKSGGTLKVKKSKSLNKNLVAGKDFKSEDINGMSTTLPSNKICKFEQNSDENIRTHNSSNNFKKPKMKSHSTANNMLKSDKLKDDGSSIHVHASKNNESYQSSGDKKKPSKKLEGNDSCISTVKDKHYSHQTIKSKNHHEVKKSSEKIVKNKLEVNAAEEFTSSEASFEACLGFNDIVKKKKKKSSKVQNLHPVSKTEKNTKSSPDKFEVSPKKQIEVSPKKQIEVSPKKQIEVSPKKQIEVSPKKQIEVSPKIQIEVKSQDSMKSKMQFHPNMIEFEQNFKVTEVDILSTLPAIQPNYKPLPHRDSESFLTKKKSLSNEEAIMFTSSKKEKTVVYSGRKNCFLAEVPSLYDSCVRILVENVDYITYTGAIPYFLLKPVLDRCTASQLFNVEYYNAYLVEDTNELWEKHCKRELKGKVPDENETWREMYCRIVEERKNKLKSLTANISASMSKHLPARKVKLTYIDSVVKPPRDVARKQAKNGTGLPVNFPMKGEPPSKSGPRPTAPAINAAAVSSVSTAPFIPKSNISKVISKPKIAPLMAKTLKSMKQCYRRK